MSAITCLDAPSAVDFVFPNMARSPDDPAQVLLSVGGLVGQEVQLDELLQALVDRVARAMQADRGTLWLIDHARQELFTRRAPARAEADPGQGRPGNRGPRRGQRRRGQHADRAGREALQPRD
jgi:hypothetical protein